MATKLGKKKIQVIHNGVALGQILSADVEHSDDLLSSDKDPRSLILGTVGRLIPEKGLQVLFHALKRTMLSGFTFQVVVVGDGPCLRNLRREVESIGVAANVLFTGEVDRRTVYQLLYGFDIFVMSSYTEGFCNAVVEAMAARRCLVCSDAGALPEVVGDATITVPVGSAEKLASALEAIATNPELRQQLGQRARQRATQMYSLDRAAEKHDRMYRSLLI